TPNMDRIAAEGVHFRNAFVTTSLCSPSRASILTGQYMHNHGVVDNNKPPTEGTIYFPQMLQAAGYETAFIGKWHMGEGASGEKRIDDPQPGFDHWVSFRGQGNYAPVRRDGSAYQLNVNGKRVPRKAYITDELTDYALQWLRKRDGDQPFFLYLSHKAVHANFCKPGQYPREQQGQADVGTEPAQQLARRRLSLPQFARRAVLQDAVPPRALGRG
ncbi:MAG: sulfatase-like hydrolase/transferase, partial [Woeseiaceae bacterium]